MSRRHNTRLPVPGYPDAVAVVHGDVELTPESHEALSVIAKAAIEHLAAGRSSRVDEALADWRVAERFLALAVKVERMSGPSCYTLTWRAREARARTRLRHAVIMAEAGGEP